MNTPSHHPKAAAGTELDPSAAAELATHLAQAEHLLVVSDFDGTLAPFHNDIYATGASQRALAALADLAHSPQTRVAILSGRHLAGLRRVMPLREPVIMAGSHGAETSGDGPLELSAEQHDRLSTIDAHLADLLARFPGTSVERKPLQRVFHSRALAQEDLAAAQQAHQEALALDGAQPGKFVVEFSVSEATKGTWISQHRHPGEQVVFLGDDRTDETAFGVLDSADTGIKVGDGDTAASWRLPDIAAVDDFLVQLASARRGDSAAGGKGGF